MRPVISAAIRLVPDPRNGSYTSSPGRMLLTIGRSMHSTGFCVACPQLCSRCRLANGLLLAISHTVDCFRGALGLEFANPRRQHESAALRKYKVPDKLILI